MKQNKYKKFLIISLCIIFAIISIFSAVIAENTLHSDNCRMPECPICEFISIANTFIKNIILTTDDIQLLIFILPLIKLIIEKIKKIKTQTLVELKVIQNN